MSELTWEPACRQRVEAAMQAEIDLRNMHVGNDDALLMIIGIVLAKAKGALQPVLEPTVAVPKLAFVAALCSHWLHDRGAGPPACVALYDAVRDAVYRQRTWQPPCAVAVLSMHEAYEQLCATPRDRRIASNADSPLSTFLRWTLFVLAKAVMAADPPRPEERSG